TSTVDGAANYGYDVTNQVATAAYTGTGQPANEAYSYTKNGSRANTGYQTGTNNQLLSDGTFNYQYDPEGNRTVRTRIANAPASDYKTTYSWDYRNRLTDVEYFNNSGVLTKHVHYVYDALDHEIGKQVDDTGGGTYNRSEWYVLDVSPVTPAADQPSGALADPLLQFDTSGNLQFRYFSGPSAAGDDTVYTEEQIGTQGQAGTETWPLGDNENTPHEDVNNGSAVVDHIIANTFGVVTSESAPTVHHWSGFEGAHLDVDTAAIDDYFRWYDPATAKWLSEDPKGFTAHDADLTRYVGNSPTGQFDPLGEAAPNNPLGNYLSQVPPPPQLQPGPVPLADLSIAPTGPFFTWPGPQQPGPLSGPTPASGFGNDAPPDAPLYQPGSFLNQPIQPAGPPMSANNFGSDIEPLGPLGGSLIARDLSDRNSMLSRENTITSYGGLFSNPLGIQNGFDASKMFQLENYFRGEPDLWELSIKNEDGAAKVEALLKLYKIEHFYAGIGTSWKIQCTHDWVKQLFEETQMIGIGAGAAW
ncbi:MAG: RHS repeat domain-containing protein, partial [Candidatus Saccharimonadales bacterium]